jgi:hypothetical protein
MERSSSTSNDGFLSTCFRIEKLRRSKSGCSLTLVWKSSAGIAVAHVQMVQGKERHKREPIADRWHLLANLSETMKGFFLEPRNPCSNPWSTSHRWKCLRRRRNRLLPGRPA